MRVAELYREVEPSAVEVLPPVGIDAKTAGSHLAAEVAPVAAKAQALVIVTPDDHVDAQEWLRDVVMPRRRAIEEFFKPIKDSLHKAHRDICERERTVLATVPDAIVRDKILTWEREQERKRREAEAEARRLAAEAAERERIAAAEAALDAGKTDEAEAILEAPAEVQLVAPVSTPQPLRAVGTGRRDNWKAQVDSLVDLVKWVAEMPAERIDCVMACQSALDSRAKRLKDSLRIPGVSVTNTPSMTVRR